MAKAFSVASWNVEHFRSQGVSSRVDDVVEFLAEQRPDVFALYEVEGREVFDALTTLMPEYTFHITEGQQVQQIPSFLEQFGLRQPDVWLARGARRRDLCVNSDIPGWFARVTRSWAREGRRFRGIPLVLVHGDTMTTVLATANGSALVANAIARRFRA